MSDYADNCPDSLLDLFLNGKIEGTNLELRQINEISIVFM